jgi:hypothetical protein
MKLAEKFFNESYENEKRFKLEAEKEKAKKLKDRCTEIFEKIILPKIVIAVRNGFYTANFEISEFNGCAINLTDFFNFLKSEDFCVNEKFAQNAFSISWNIKDPYGRR